MSKTKEKRGQQGPTLDQNNTFEGLLGGNLSSAGQRVNSKTALEVSAFWAGAEIIPQSVAKVKIELSDLEPDGTTTPRMSDPRYRLVAVQPNPRQTAGEFWSTLVANALVYRNGYAEIIRDPGSMEPIELKHIEACHVTPTADNVTQNLTLENLIYGVSDRLNNWRFVRPENMIHIRAQTLDGVCGLGIPEYPRDSVGVAVGRRKFAGSFFANGGRPGGILKYPARWSKEDRDAVERDFRQAYERPDAAFKTIGQRYSSDKDEVEFIQNQGHTFEQTQMYEGSESDVREMARLLNIQPHLLGDMTAASYNSLEQQQAAFWTVSLSNWTRRIADQCFLRLLFKPERDAGNLVFTHNLNTLDYADSSVTAEVASKLVTAGVMTRNDARRLFNLPPMDGGDELLLPPGNKAEGSENGSDNVPEPTN